MQQKRLREALKDKSKFIIVAELSGGPDYNSFLVENFLKDYKVAGDSSIPEGFDFVGITSPHNPGGTPNIETANVLYHMQAQGLLGNLDFIPHISCKDENSDSLASSLISFRSMNVETVFVITGDKPLKGKGIFELESIGLLQLIEKMNAEAYLKAPLETLDNVHQFFAGAAVSPFKYTEPSQMQQYYKMKKKIASGAKYIITQVGWDWKKSVELFRYLEENNIDVPVLGNVFVLSKLTPAPRLMHDLKLPGCFVSDKLLAKVNSENISEHLEQAAQQVAMYKSIGAAGVDIGSIPVLDMLVYIIQRASEISEGWVEHKDNLYWPKEGGFYLYDEKGRHAVLSKPREKFSQKFFNFMHRNFFTKNTRTFNNIKKVMTSLGMQKKKGLAYEFFSASEYAIKRFLFDCEMCGDCYLPEDFGLCTIGGCEKGLANAPCGDATVDGYCGNNLDLVCIGERIYNAAVSQADGIEKWQRTINKPRIHSLEQSASILNLLFGKDHNAKVPFICIGELIDASIPKTGKVIQQLHDLGADAYLKPSGQLNYIRAMIESQAAENPDYIAVNLDAVGQENPKLAANMMVEYVRMVRKWGETIPVCIDSNNNEIIIAGLKIWYNAGQPVKPPLLSSIKLETIDEILALKKSYDFKFAAFLGNEQLADNIGTELINRSHLLAKQTLIKAVEKYGFKPDDIFFELDICPLSSDIPHADGMPGHTHITFKIAQKIKNDRQMASAHCLTRPGAAGQKLPRSLGICRAYIGKALEYGFDAAFVNVADRFGVVQPDPELIKLVDAYAKLDGTTKNKEEAEILMNRLRQPKKKKLSEMKTF